MKPKRLPAHSNDFKLQEALQGVFSPHNLPYQMRLLVQLMTRRFQGLIEPYDLTPLHWGVLSCLWSQDGLPTQAIAERLEQLGGTVTVGLDAMEKRGLLRRKLDPRDRRISRVWLTKKGVKLQQKLVPLVAAFVEEMFSCLTVEEYSALHQTIHHLREHIENMPLPG